MAVTIFLNTQCQLKCRYCFGWDEKDNKQNNISIEKVEELCNAFWQKGHRYITLTGGEPFLHPDIFKIIQKVHEKGFWITILTNGLDIDDKMALLLSKFWRLQVRVSLEGADKDVHEYFRGPGTFDPMVGNIERLRTFNVHVNLGLTIYDENKNQIRKVARFCREHGCSSLRVVPVVRIAEGKNATTSRELYETILREILFVSLELKKYIQLSEKNSFPYLPVASFTTKRCFAGDGFLGVGVENVLMPCSLIRFAKGLPLVKYTKPNDLDTLKHKMQEYFSDIKFNQKGVCKQCEFLDHCQGGCLGEKLSFGLDVTDGQPVCMKTLISKVISDFNYTDIKPIIDSWLADTLSAVENISDGYCIRQAPFWKIAFKRMHNFHE